MFRYMYVFRPNREADWIIPIGEEDETHVYDFCKQKWPKRIIDSKTTYRGDYYFSSEELKNAFMEAYYKR